MKPRYLITTADERSWPDNSQIPVLFLGEWCRLYSRRERWLRMDAKVMPYHWDNRQKLHTDYLYLRDFYERLLPMLGQKLNVLHGVDFSTKYWRILIGPWLGYFLQMLFDRWASINQALDAYELEGTTVLEFQENTMIPQSMRDFTHFYTNDEWNHHVYSQIIRRISGIPQKTTRCKPQVNLIVYEALTRQEPFIHKFKKRIATHLFDLLSHFSRQNDAVFVATYLPYHIQWKLDWRFRQIPQFRAYKPVSYSPEDMDKRSWTIKMEDCPAFEQFVGEILARHMPVAYLEGYPGLIKQVAQNGWPRSPKLIWTSNAENSDEHFKAYAAEKVEQGTPLVMGQHGGHYGLGLWSFTEDHHLAIADSYFSWGWTEDQTSHIRPCGQFKCKKPLGVTHSKQDRLLLVTCTVPRYSYHMYSIIVSRQWLDYLEDQFAFCRSLPLHLRRALTVRLYPNDYGWDQTLRWQDEWPDVELDSGRRKMDSLIRECRIYVSTYNATTYLESFTMNVPTVIFWNTEHWEIRESAKPYLDELEKAGIFHKTPEGAARHVATVWNDVQAWWESSDVQQVRQKFCERYARMPDNLPRRVENALRDVVKIARARKKMRQPSSDFTHVTGNMQLAKPDIEKMD